MSFFIKKNPQSLIQGISPRKRKKGIILFLKKAYPNDLKLGTLFNKIYGIGLKYYIIIICLLMNVSVNMKLYFVYNTRNFITLNALFREFFLDFILMKKIKDSIFGKKISGTYHGVRHTQGLPVRGQRSTNAGTQRRLNLSKRSRNMDTNNNRMSKVFRVRKGVGKK